MCRVLVIEDDGDVRHQLVATLRLAGHDVSEADNGCDGLSLVESCTPEVAIVDILMPGLDGLETISAVKARHPEVHIVAISGGGMINGLQYLRIAQLLGAHRTLEKPIWPAQLVAVVRDLAPARAGN
ncbi:MAG: response regulator [Gemmatimonadales bacterium]